MTCLNCKVNKIIYKEFGLCRRCNSNRLYRNRPTFEKDLKMIKRKRDNPTLYKSDKHGSYYEDKNTVEISELLLKYAKNVKAYK